MSTEHGFKAVCSVSELAERLGLSRARFYQLQRTGVFPRPVHSGQTKRPFYPLDLQQKCIEIRKKGIGLNSRPVLFNRPRRNSRPQEHSDSKHRELARTLRHMGLNVTADTVKSAIDMLYPRGFTKRLNEDLVIRDLSKHFSSDRRNDV
jgi:hypothetical protein